MRTSNKGIKLIQDFEGLRLKAYLCPANVWTIGYGHTAGVKRGDQLTQEQAQELLTEDLAIYEAPVNAQRLDVNQNQFDALVSFCYNVGAGNLQKSTLLKKVKTNPADPTIRHEFMKWSKGGGKVLTGLVRRRRAEADLYFTTP